MRGRLKPLPVPVLGHMIHPDMWSGPPLGRAAYAVRRGLDNINAFAAAAYIAWGSSTVPASIVSHL